MSIIIEAKKMSLGYKGENVIMDTSFAIHHKEFVFITGKSGSGKSTILSSLYGHLPVRKGSLEVNGVNMGRANKSKIHNLRRNLGIVFQDYKLVKEWSVEKNIMLPMIINGYKKETCKAQVDRLLAHIQLSHKANKYPLELSGGEQQRVAMARALAHNPSIILADEPTGNLDDFSSEIIWNLLKGVNEQLNITIVVVTHRLPERMNINYRRLHIEEGVVYEFA